LRAAGHSSRNCAQTRRTTGTAQGCLGRVVLNFSRDHPRPSSRASASQADRRPRLLYLRRPNRHRAEQPRHRSNQAVRIRLQNHRSAGPRAESAVHAPTVKHEGDAAVQRFFRPQTKPSSRNRLFRRACRLHSADKSLLRRFVAPSHSRSHTQGRRRRPPIRSWTRLHRLRAQRVRHNGGRGIFASGAAGFTI
jgi:hypothetical protein